MNRLLSGQPSTLQLSSPFGHTLVLALLILALLVSGLEAVSRLPAVTARLPAPSIDSSRFGFEADLNYLDAEYDRQGRIDCLFMGSSVVLRSVNPRVLERTYQERTGQTIRCANVAMNSFLPSDAVPFAEFLIERYRPRLLVYGLSAREFSGRIEARRKADPVDLPWMKYQRGEFNAEGWLIDRLQSYRYYLVVDDWMSIKFLNQYRERLDYKREVKLYSGYKPDGRIFEVPDNLTTLRAKRRLGSKVDPMAADRIASFIHLNSQFPDTELALIEIPLHPLFFATLMSEDTYHTLITGVEAEARQQGVFFLRDTTLPSLPPEAWYDEVHMNSTGAQIYSAWLGEQMGTAVSEKRLLRSLP